MHVAATEVRSAALRTLLRSFGQVVLQANAFTGVCVLAAWLVADVRLAGAALLGTVAANLSAVLAGYRDDDTRAGLRGFNGALAGLAAFSFIADTGTAAAVAILAATAAAWLQEPWSRWLRARGLSCFSSPYLIITWLWLSLPIVTSGTPRASMVPMHVQGVVQWGRGLLSGIAQMGFVAGALPGVLVLIGIAAASRRHALWALIGTTMASAAHRLLLGAAPGSFDAGLLGFNGALTALALVDGGVVSMLGGVAVSVVLQAVAVRCGWPVMTAPFVVATWCVQGGRRWVGCGMRVGAATEPVGRTESKMPVGREG